MEEERTKGVRIKGSPARWLRNENGALEDRAGLGRGNGGG